MRVLFCCFMVLTILSCNEKKRAVQVHEIPAVDFPYKFSVDLAQEYKYDSLFQQGQIAGTRYSFIGNEELVAQNFYHNLPDREALGDSVYTVFTKSHVAVNAFEYILERAKEEQMLILNEAHHKPKHRVFTRQLLQELFNNGFRYFGAEALNELDIIDLNYRRCPIYFSGFYTDEPQFGELVRDALSIGYEVFAYEGEGNGKSREINQAKNIAEFLKNKPNAKTLIHCGYQHAQEGTINSSWEKAMAGRVLEYTGINPLTVNQTWYDNKYYSKHLTPLQKRIDISEPSVFVDSSGFSYLGASDTSGFDIVVFHEQSEYINGRPTWLLGKNKEWVEVDLNPSGLDYPYFLFAFKTGENITEAIPVDLLEITDSLQTAHFALSKGKYEIVAQSITKKAASFNLEVE